MKKTDAFELCCKKNKQVYKWSEGFTIKQQLGFRKKEDRNNVEKETYSINNVTTDSQGIKIAINGNSFSASSKLVRAIGYIRNYTRPWEDHKEKGLQNQ